MTRVVVIGCGAAGATAALWARKADRKAEVIVIGDEPYPEYSRCGLPYTISGKVKDFNDLILMKQDAWEMQKIDLRLEQIVKEIDRKEKKVKVVKKDGTEYELNYDSLVIATGGRNSYPPIKGLDVEGVMGLRTLEDAKRLKEYSKKIKKAVIIGGGLIGMEVAEALNEEKIDVTVVEFLPGILLTMLDSDLSKQVTELAQEHGVKVLVNHQAMEIISENGKAVGVLVKNRETEEEFKIDAEVVIVATGTKPNIELAKSAGIEIGVTGAIKTDEYMRTSDLNIYAVGDCAENISYITKKPMNLGLGTIAVREGRVAGINAVGGNAKFMGIIGTKVTKLFGVEIASVGLTSEDAKRNEINIVKGSLKGLSKPPYYVEAKPLKVKAFFKKDDAKLVGAQTLGEDDAAQRINVFALGIQMGADVNQIFDLENCYAPAVADTWDPICLAADAAKKRLKIKY